MSEARDRLLGQESVDSPSFYGIRHGYYVSSRSRNGTGVHRPASDNNKENAATGSSSSGRRRIRPRKSQLPTWYPRTPLRDITEIVNAMERRRVRLRSEVVRHQELVSFHQMAFTSPLSVQAPSVAEETPQQLPSEHPSPAAKSSVDPVVKETEETKHFVSDPNLGDQRTESARKKLEDFEEIEKLVSEKLTAMKRSARKQRKSRNARSTLMSMR